MVLEIYGKVCNYCFRSLAIDHKSKYCNEKCSKGACNQRNRERHGEAKRNYNKEYRKSHAKQIGDYKKQRRLIGYKSYYKQHSSDERIQEILKEQAGCLVCGAEKVEAHHIRPRAVGGLHTRGNIMLLCKVHHALFDRLTKAIFNNGK